MRRPPMFLVLAVGCLIALPVVDDATAQCLPPFWDPTVGDPGMDGPVFALASFPTGGVTCLYAGGDFASAGGSAANRIARWDGTSWAPVGSGVDNGAVRALAVYDDGNGPDLYVAGQFNVAGGVAVNRIARWDGGTWSDVGNGVSGAIIYALAVFDDGGGAQLFAAGNFSSAGGAPVSNLASWDGATWSDVGGGVNDSALALAVHDDGTGAALYAGGFFSTAGGQSVGNIARWDGSSWSELGSGANNAVWSLASHDTGSGTDLYAGGDFTSAGGGAAEHIARWDGSEWSALGAGVNGTVWTMRGFDNGTLPGLHVGGAFTTAGAVDANRIARWDGVAWFSLAGGADDDVRALEVFDDLSTAGESLYASGLFSSMDGQVAERLSRWIPCPEGVPILFVRGDADGNGLFNGLIDGLFLLNFQFASGPTPPCLEAADADGNDSVNGLVDALYVLNAQFSGGPLPPSPYPDCGVDDNYLLGCEVVPDLCF